MFFVSFLTDHSTGDAVKVSLEVRIAPTEVTSRKEENVITCCKK